MKKAFRYLAFVALWISLVLLLVGLTLAVGQNDKSTSASANPDMIVTVSEDYLNRIIKARLEEKNPLGVKDVNVQLKENEPIEIYAALKIDSGLLAVDQNVFIEANVSIDNDTLKVDPKVIRVGSLNLPEDTWVGPIKFAMQEVEASANEVYQNALMKGYKVTNVATRNNPDAILGWLLTIPFFE
jgi:hypothetical protein